MVTTILQTVAGLLAVLYVAVAAAVEIVVDAARQLGVAKEVP